jgi:hypothetical protein
MARIITRYNDPAISRCDTSLAIEAPRRKGWGMARFSVSPIILKEVHRGYKEGFHAHLSAGEGV